MIAAAVTLGIIAAVLIAYQALVEIPREKIESQEKTLMLEKVAEEAKEAQREEKYNNCMMFAYTDYNTNWNSACTLAEKEAECSLPTYKADSLEEKWEQEKDRCVQMYK